MYIYFFVQARSYVLRTDEREKKKIKLNKNKKQKKTIPVVN